MSDQWIEERVAPNERKWEDFYRNRFQHDKRVRTTHGVNCTGSCSWEVFVKNGIVTWGATGDRLSRTRRRPSAV